MISISLTGSCSWMCRWFLITAANSLLFTIPELSIIRAFGFWNAAQWRLTTRRRRTSQRPSFCLLAPTAAPEWCTCSRRMQHEGWRHRSTTSRAYFGGQGKCRQCRAAGHDK
jgi:hypothetical protein